MTTKWVLIAAVILLVGCSSGKQGHVAGSPRRSHTASPTSSGVPGSAPPAAIACQKFRAATSALSKVQAQGGTNLGALKKYGDTLIKATKPLNSATPNPDPALTTALSLAGAANLAIAVGYEPHGVAAAYKVATKYVNAVGKGCAALGY